ncbi:MAG TPA: sulfotransferase [Steroidobacteraceae bacterium]|jgi:tetratricopeptide (TPR) repeat protein|nr:sulfotransferase [Steroidobacteraceae bacterium]
MQTDASATPEDPLQIGLARVRELRNRGALDAATALLGELSSDFPSSGLLWQERALCLQLQGDAAAGAAFRRAVELNDTLVESWLALVELFRVAGQEAEAQHASACIAKLRSLPSALLQASSLLNEGRVDEAEAQVRDYFHRHGPHLDALRLLAQVRIKRDVLDDAELLLEEVLEKSPEYHDARSELAGVLMQRRRYLPALMHARQLLQIDPRNRLWRGLYADAVNGLGEYDEALRAYRDLQADMPDDANMRITIGHALRNQGDSAAAIAEFQAATAAPDTAAEAFLSLANVKSYRFGDEELMTMRRLEAEAAAPGRLTDRYQLCFALGKALEERREYEESFRYYARGNALKRSELVYKSDVTERNLRLQATVCTAEFLAAREGLGCPRPDPIFIVGLPRSGSTLIEQILSSHSQVEGTLELPEIPRLVQQFRTRKAGEPPRYPGVLAELSPEELRRMGEIYLEETGVYRQRAPFFIDKMPGNFHDIGFIHLILPNAKIIEARREAMACCFGNFKQLFANGQKFTYDLTEMGHYYRGYIELMEHWHRALPGKILRVQHSDVVQDLEGSVRRILEFCGLEFEPACLEYYKTDRVVRTLSADQVRRPIYREGLDQWRHYEPWLGPLKAALGPLAGT